MNHMLPEGLHPQPEGYTREELLLAMQQCRVLQARAVLCDERHALHVPLGCCEGVIERAEGARGIAGGQTRDLAILSCVGRPVCFHVLGFFPDGRARLSRRSAQEQALDLLLRQRPGEILPAVVTGLAEFGAFCDIGCGIAALLPIDCLSVSRIASPADRVQVGQQLLCAIKNRDVQGRIVLTLRELLGTWSENAACFAAGETVVGIVRSVEEYGVFIEIAPNLAGLAEADSTLRPGQAVSVYIKNILPDKMKIKLVVVNKNLGQPLRFEPHYFVTRGRLKRWTYSTPQSRKQIETVF